MSELQEKINHVKQCLHDIAVLCEEEMKATTARFAQTIADAELQMIERKRMLEEEFRTAERDHQAQMLRLIVQQDELKQSVDSLKLVAQQLRAAALAVPV